MLDVLVIGAGPAGSAAAALLARAGCSVRVIERARFPRAHVGESLLPCCVPVLERLGIDTREDLRKDGAEFRDEASGDSVRFRFAEGFPGSPPHAWQVDRPSFDARLAERARAAGAELSFASSVRSVAFEPDRVRATLANGERVEARYLVDASGQATFLARRQRSLAPCYAFGRAAVYAQFRGLAPAVREELEETGNIIILLRPAGWAWVIPLSGGVVSVGFVTRERLREDAFAAGMTDSPLLQRLARGAERGPLRRVGDFSYANLRPYGTRYACVGDAACFLDPVFSSGVSLALLGAEGLAERLAPALAEGREGDPALLAGLADRLDKAYATFANFIHRFYSTGLVRNLFFAPDPDPELRRGIIGILSGDLWRDGNRFQEMLLQPGRRGFSWPPPPPASRLAEAEGMP